ncbi:hypothetical protein C8R44DRAFT_728741 [Mycena epipterygia]|nr:hypothetical protein C8R44DRAFT_728741 [Mycena epipterygia]
MYEVTSVFQSMAANVTKLGTLCPYDGIQALEAMFEAIPLRSSDLGIILQQMLPKFNRDHTIFEAGFRPPTFRRDFLSQFGPSKALPIALKRKRSEKTDGEQPINELMHDHAPPGSWYILSTAGLKTQSELLGRFSLGFTCLISNRFNAGGGHRSGKSVVEPPGSGVGIDRLFPSYCENRGDTRDLGPSIRRPDQDGNPLLLLVASFVPQFSSRLRR